LTVTALTENRKELVRYWWPVAVWITIVAYSSTGAGAGNRTMAILQWIVATLELNARYDQLVFAHFLIRKTAHFLNYAVLSILIFRALRGTSLERVGWRNTWMWVSLVGTFVVACGDELHQYFTPFREGAWQDVVLDVAGAAFAQSLIWFGTVKRSFGSGGARGAVTSEQQKHA
jgi:VanZ family protein